MFLTYRECAMTFTDVEVTFLLTLFGGNMNKLSRTLCKNTAKKIILLDKNRFPCDLYLEATVQ